MRLSPPGTGRGASETGGWAGGDGGRDWSTAEPGGGEQGSVRQTSRCTGDEMLGWHHRLDVHGFE